MTAAELRALLSEAGLVGAAVTACPGPASEVATRGSAPRPRPPGSFAVSIGLDDWLVDPSPVNDWRAHRRESFVCHDLRGVARLFVALANHKHFALSSALGLPDAAGVRSLSARVAQLEAAIRRLGYDPDVLAKQEEPPP